MSDTPRTDAIRKRHGEETRALCERNPHHADKRNIEWQEHSVRQAKELLLHTEKLERELAVYQKAEMPEEPFPFLLGKTEVVLASRYDGLRAHLARVTVERNEAKERVIALESTNSNLADTNIALADEIDEAKEAQARAEIELKAAHLVRDANRIRAEAAESEIAAVAGEPLTWGQKQDLIRYWSIRDVNECVNEIVRLSAAPAAPEGMKLVQMDSTDCIICKKKANPWTARIVPEKGLICVYCCDLEDAQETAPSAPAAQEGMVMVPQHPTSDQMQAGRDEWLTIKEQPDIMSIEMKCLRIYNAMLAACGEKKT